MFKQISISSLMVLFSLQLVSLSSAQAELHKLPTADQEKIAGVVLLAGGLALPDTLGKYRWIPYSLGAISLLDGFFGIGGYAFGGSSKSASAPSTSQASRKDVASNVVSPKQTASLVKTSQGL